MLPVIGLTVCAVNGNIYAGLIYPIAIALLTFVVGTITLRETRHIKIWHEVHEPEPPRAPQGFPVSPSSETRRP